MPSKSKAQHRLMKIASYNEKFAKARGIDQKMAREFIEEDERLEKLHPGHLESLPDSMGGDSKHKSETGLSAGALDTLRKLSEHGPQDDGDLPSKKGMDELIALGYAKKDYSKKLPNILTPKGEKQAKEESFEGFFSDIIGGLFGRSSSSSSHRTPSNTPAVSPKETAVQNLIHHPDQLSSVKFKTGMIAAHSLSTEFRLKQFDENSYLNTLERAVVKFVQFWKPYEKLRYEVSMEMKKIYEKCREMDPAKAYAYAKPLVEKLRKKLDPHQPPELDGILLQVEKKEHGYSISLSGMPGSVNHIKAVDHNAAKKIIQLIIRIADDVPLYSVGEYDEWCLDDTDDLKWWSYKYPDDDTEISHLLNLFPYAGEFEHYDYEYTYTAYFKNVMKGLSTILRESLDM